MKLEIRRRVLPLAQPFATAFGTLRERETLLVALTDRDGVTGLGEAAPLEPYDGVSIEAAMDALERCRHPLERAALSAEGRPDEDAAARALIERCRAQCDLPPALAAIDVALWDIAALRRGVPLCRLLSDAVPVAPTVPVSATIAATDRAQAAKQAATALREGFACVKLKVGVGDDAGRLAAVRSAAGPQLALRIDANGAWRVEEAVAAITALAPVGLELVEEPVHGAAALREVRARVEVRVAADESAMEPAVLDGAADAVCLKLARCGGITPLLDAAARARAAGGEVYLGSTLEGPVGIAAALHVAAALAADGPLPPCGLATLRMFAAFAGALPVARGAIAVPRSPGLGSGER